MDIEDNTTVFATLKSLNTFISRTDPLKRPHETPTGGSNLQTQYNRNMELLDAAERARSKNQYIQLDKEKKQMELSHKRARFELEKVASDNAHDLEREVDRNQDLQGKIKRLEQREEEAAKTLSEHLGNNGALRKNLNDLTKKGAERDVKLNTANQMVSGLKDEIRELKQTVQNQDCTISTKTLENRALQEQLDMQRRQNQEASQLCQSLLSAQSSASEHVIKIKELERRLSLQEQDIALVKTMRSEVAKVQDLDKEVRHLRDENAYLRESRENSSLLKEEVEGLRRKLERLDKTKEDLVNMELEREVESRENSSLLKEEVEGLRRKLERLDKTKEDLVNMELEREERDGMRSILESYDSELAHSEYSPQLSKRLREAEDILQKTQSQYAEVEAQLTKAQEESGTLKLQLQTAELELESVKKQQSAVAEGNSPMVKEEVSLLRQKIEDVEAQRQQLEEQNNILEMRLERHSLQGDYDPVKTRVLHFKMNPTNVAKQQRHQEAEALREEVTHLRKQMESSELRNQRLKEVFQRKIQEFRTVCYVLTGYQIDVTTETQYRLSSGSSGTMQLMETEFSKTLGEMVDLHLHHQKSIPAFLSSLTLDLFSRQTTF
ncbi:hypothetical protein CRUP_013801 [Coryphaenoides rupestris]|nr:hypothetical protein CRUP_013801 [Coryphaenoides rupestris]